LEFNLNQALDTPQRKRSNWANFKHHLF
jgi:hypothetical protein